MLQRAYPWKLNLAKFPINIQSIYILAMSIYMFTETYMFIIWLLYILLLLYIAWTDSLQKCWLPTCDDHNYSCIIRTSHGHWFQNTRYRKYLLGSKTDHCISVFIIVKNGLGSEIAVPTTMQEYMHVYTLTHDHALKVIYISIGVIWP